MARKFSGFDDYLKKRKEQEEKEEEERKREQKQSRTKESDQAARNGKQLGVASTTAKTIATGTQTSSSNRGYREGDEKRRLDQQQYNAKIRNAKANAENAWNKFVTTDTGYRSLAQQADTMPGLRDRVSTDRAQRATDTAVRAQNFASALYDYGTASNNYGAANDAYNLYKKAMETSDKAWKQEEQRKISSGQRQAATVTGASNQGQAARDMDMADFYSRMTKAAGETGNKEQSSYAMQQYAQRFKSGSDAWKRAERQQDELNRQQNPAQWYGDNLSREQIEGQLRILDKQIEEETANNRTRYNTWAQWNGPADQYAATEYAYNQSEERLKQLQEQKQRYTAALNYRKQQDALAKRDIYQKYANEVGSPVRTGTELPSLDNPPTIGVTDPTKQIKTEETKVMRGAKAYNDYLKENTSVHYTTYGQNSTEYSRLNSGVFNIDDDTNRLTQEDKNIFYAMFDDDPEAALEWANQMVGIRQEEFFSGASEYVGDSSVRRAAGLLAGPLAGLASGLDPYGSWGQEMSRYSEAITSGGAAGVTEHGLFGTGLGAGEINVPVLGKVSLGTFYNIGSSMVQSGMIALPAMAIGDATATAKVLQTIAEAIGTTLMGSGAAASDYRERIKAGWSEEAAMQHAYWAALAEAGFEYISLDKLVDQDVTRSIVSNFFVQGGIEASEEFSTTIANRITDAVIARQNGYDNSVEERANELMAQGYSYDGAHQQADHEWFTELANDAFAGFISGGGMTVGHVVPARISQAMYNSRMNQATGQRMQNTSGAVESITKFGADNGMAVTNRDSSIGRAANKTTAQIQQQMEKTGTIEGANQVYNDLVQKYGDGIRSVADDALSTAVSKIAQNGVRANMSLSERVNNPTYSEGQKATGKTGTSAVLQQNEVVKNIQDKQAREASEYGLYTAAIDTALKSGEQSDARAAVDYGRNKGVKMTMEATVNTENGGTKQVGIVGFTKNMDSVVLADGSTVAYDSLQTDADTKDVLDIMRSSKMTDDAVVGMMEAYDKAKENGLSDPYRWAQDYVLTYNRGQVESMKIDQAVTLAENLTAEEASKAYRAGQKDAGSVDAAYVAKQEQRMKNVKPGVTGRKGTLLVGGEGEISQERYNELADDDANKVQFDAIRMIAEAGGLPVHLFESTADSEGKLTGEQGRYQNGEIWIDVNGGLNNIRTDLNRGMLAVTGHELTHWMREYANKEYNAYKDAVRQVILAEVGAKGLERMVREQMARNATLDWDGALEEVIADSGMTRMGDKEFWQALGEKLGDNRKTVMQKILDFVKGFFDKIRRALGDTSHTSEASQIVDRAEAAARNAIAEAYSEAFVRASENYQAAGPLKTGAQVDVKESIRTGTETAGIEMRQDSDGRLFFYINGKRVNHVEADYIRDHSAFGALIKTARDGFSRYGIQGHITAAEANEQFRAVADLMNLIMNTQNPEMVWEVAGSQLFSAIKSNSDGQYGTTVDFSTVCRKTAEIVKAMSERMMKLGRGLTKDEVTQLQKELIDAGAQVPCPVCYVFSRWAGAGTLLDTMRRFQEKYADAKWNDPATIQTRIKELENRDKKNERSLIRARLREEQVYTDLVAKKENLQAQNRNNRKELKKAVKEGNEEAKTRLESSIEFNEMAIKKAQKEIEQMEKDENVASQELAWLKRVRSKAGYQAVPLNVLFNMYDTKAVNAFMTKYKDSWAYRTSRGPSAGKAILPYADMRLGDMIQPLKKKSSDGYKTFANPLKIDGKFNDAQQEAIINAIARTRAQNLIGGQRFQSTSDFRYDYALDYIQVFFEAQALGSNMQTYTKIIEFGEMVARIGGDVNLSAMPINKGFVVDEADKNGKMIKGHLVYSNVTGIDINAAIRLKDQYDSAQIILVGINDDHIKLALEDSAETGGIHIGFVIPYHASGASIDEFIRVLVGNLNEEFLRKNYQDYSDVQTDKAKAKATPDQLRMRELRSMLLTGKQSVITETVDEDGKTKRTKGSRDWSPTSNDVSFMRSYASEAIDISDRSFDELKAVEDKALLGDPEAIYEYERWSADVLWNIANKMWNGGEEDGVRLNSSQAEAVMPHEYWNKTVDRAHAYVNGFIFRSYCYNLGLHPRFTGINSKGKTVDHGDFRGSTGYWKTLIDRAMYANDGTYRDQKKINMSEIDPGMVTPEYGEAHWGEFKVNEPDMERAAQVGRWEHESQHGKKNNAREDAKFASRNYSYSELSKKKPITGTRVPYSEVRKAFKSDGTVNVDWLVNHVLSQCKTVKTNAPNPTYYVKVNDIGRNVEVTSRAIEHGIVRKNTISPKTGKVQNTTEENAIGAINLVETLANSVEVNIANGRGNLDVPYSHVLVGISAVENAKGKTDYYAVRYVVEERKNQDPLLVKANVISKLYAENAKKMRTVHGQVGPKNVALARTLPHFSYNIADMLRDVKDEFKDTFSNNVYAHFGTTRQRTKFSEGEYVQQPDGTVKKVGGLKYSLRSVDPVKPSSSAWMPGATFDEVKAAHPTLFELAADESEVRNPTQIKGTVKTYRKIYDRLKAEGFDGTILDASSGLGVGTQAGRDEYGFNVEDIEPFPDKSYSPMYTDYSTLDKTYDVIISNAVLNVVPQDLRDAMVVKIGEMLKPGGRAFINVRGDDVKNASSKVAINEDAMEYFISNTGSYQKGFTKSELKAYLEDALGPGFTVKIDNTFGKASAVVTKNGSEENAKYSRRSAQEKRDAGEKLTENQFYSLYSAHKINMSGKGDVQAMIESIKRDGFRGDGGQFGNNIMPTNITYVVDDSGKRIPGNLSAQRYAPRKGEYILLVPKNGVETKGNRYNFTERVKPGYQPSFDYEIVQADYDFQPYYEMYSKAYDAQNGARLSTRDYTQKSDYEILRDADPMTAATNEEQRRILIETQKNIDNVRSMQYEINGIRKKAATASGAEKTKLERRSEVLQKKITEKVQIINKELNTAHLQNLLKAQRAEIRERVNKQYKERQTKTDIRHRIKNLHEEMRRELLKPRQGHYVPQELTGPVLDLLEMISTDTGRAKSESAQAKIDAINAAYDRIRKDNATSMYYDETVKDMLTELSGTLQGRSIYQLNADELSDVYTALKAMRTTIRNAIKADLIEKGKTIFDIGTQMINELRNSKGEHRLGILESWHKAQLSPKRAFNRFGGYMPNSAWNKTYDMLNKAQQKMLMLEMQGTRIFDPVLKSKKDFRQAKELTAHGRNDLVDVGLKDAGGNPVLITKGMMLSLYMHLQNEDNMRHLMYGGLTLPGLSQYYDGKGDAWGTKAVSIPALGARVANLDALLATEGEEAVNERYAAEEQEIREMFESIRTIIEDSLTPYERKWIATAKEFFDGFSRKELNKATVSMYGFSKARVNNYFPIATDSDFLNTDIDTIKRDVSLENAGFMKERVKASNPILLEDITKVVNRQISKVAQYAGLTESLKTFDNIYKVKQKGFVDAVKKALHSTFGDKGQKYVENLLSDIVGGRSQPASIFDRAKGNYAQAILTLNIPVMVKQAASFPTAAAVTGWTPILKALVKGGKSGLPISRANRSLIDTYSPLLWYRAQGAIDTELGDVAQKKGWLARQSWAKGIQKFDLMTVGRLWYAAEYYVKDHFKGLEKGTQEQIDSGDSPFYQKVGEVFGRIVEETQPNYTVLQRPDILRNPDKIIKAMTMFSTQRLQNANILIDAAATYNAVKQYDKKNKTAESKAMRKEAKTNLTRAISSQVASAVVLVAMDMVGKALLHRVNPYRDDDDELTPESAGLAALDSLAETLTGAFLWGSETFDVVNSILTGSKYYENDVGGISTINSLLSGFVELAQKANKMFDGEDTPTKDDWLGLLKKESLNLLKPLAQMTGMPIENIQKIGHGLYEHALDAAEGQLGSFEAGLERSQKTNARRFTEALEYGDTEKANKILEEMRRNILNDKPGLSEDKVNKRIQNAITSRIRDLYEAGEMSETFAIKWLVDYGNADDENDAYWKVQEWKAKAEHKGEEDYTFNKYEDLRAMLDAGQDITDEMQRLMDHGVTEKAVNDEISKYIKMLYTSGTISEDVAIDLLTKYHKRTEKGEYRPETANEAWFTVDEWKDKADNEEGDDSYQKYRNVYAAMDAGEDITAAVTELTDHGVKPETVNKEIGEYIRKRFEEGEISEDEAIRLLMQYHQTTKDGAYHADTEDEAWKKVQEWAAKAEHADEEDYSYSQYDEIDEALAGNKDITGLVKELTDHGIKADSVNSHVKSWLIDNYVKGGVSETALKNQLARYLKITATDDVSKILRDANSKKEFGVAYSSVDEEYRAGKISKQQLRNALVKYGDMDGDAADKKIRWYDVQKQYPDMEITESRVNAYYDGTSKTRENGHQSAKDVGMSVTKYMEARDILDKVTGTDANNDGKTDTYSKEKAYIAAISNISGLTSEQRWALYYEVYKGANWKKVARPNW
jgi:hypothetical protein